MQEAWLQRAELLCVEGQVRRHERIGRAAPKGAGDREHEAEEAACQLDARDRRDARGAQGKEVAVEARRKVVRQLQERGLSKRQASRQVGMSASTLRYEPRDDGNGRRLTSSRP